MHPKLVEYVNRFTDPGVVPEQTNFFTALGENYFSELAYIFDIPVFCLRLLLAKLTADKICIYSDYDTDAITATATMYWGLVEFGFAQDKISFYAPDRFIEGYGINGEALEKLAATNQLIISVDCGINSVAEAMAIKSSGCDLLITDHHQLRSEVPDCLAVCNPRLAELYQDPDQRLAQQNHEKLQIEKLLRQIRDLDENSYLTSQRWLETLAQTPKNNFLSSSVTGVGVAWFCLVWLGYFLESVDLEPLEPLKS